MAAKKKSKKKTAARPRKARRAAPRKRPAKRAKRKSTGARVVKRARVGKLKVEIRKAASGYVGRVCTPIVGVGTSPAAALRETKALLTGRRSSGAGNLREQRLRRRLAGF